MNNHIAIYGFTKEQLSLLLAYMPDGYFFRKVTDVTELIAAGRICNIIYSERMNTKSREFLDSFYLDVGENADEQVIWIDSCTKPPVLNGIYYHYDDLLKLLPELKKVLDRAQKHYMIQQVFHGAYAFLPKRGIEEILEDELCIARLNYIKNEEQQIVKRVRREWVSLLETDSVAELAAVYELCIWLRKNKHPYRLGGTAVSGFIPYLFGIHEINPLPPHLYCAKCKNIIWREDYKDGFDIPPEVCPACGGLMQGDGHNLVWQEYASYGRLPTYVFYLPYDMQPIITDWLDNHWLRKHMGDQWEAAQPYEDHLVRGNMHFRFELDRDEISPDFHSISIDAGSSLSLSDLPICREDVFFYLKDHGFVDKDAFRGMTSVRKGRGLPVITEEMRAAEDYWKAEYFSQIDWIPSKADLLQRMFFELKS